MTQREELHEEFADRLIERGLAEIAGNRRPPDLTARVLSAVNATPRDRRRQAMALRGLMLAATVALMVAVWTIDQSRESTEQVAAVDPPRVDTAVVRPPVPATSHEQLADLVDDFNRLMKENRFDEADVVYQRAATIAPNELVVRQMKNTAKLVARTRNNSPIREPAEQGQFAALQSVEQSTLPFDDRKPYQFGTLRGRYGEGDGVTLLRHKGIIDQLYQSELSRIPTPDEPPILYPDPETWRLLAERRKKYRAVLEGRDSPDLAGQAEKTANRLKLPVSLNYKHSPLSQVISDLEKLSGVRMDLDEAGIAEIRIATDAPVTLELAHDVSLKSALRLILEPLHLNFVIQGDGLKISNERVCNEERLAIRRDRYSRIIENPFLAAVDNPLSTFSIDVDTASYAKVRRYLLESGELPPPDAVRIEELVNYFDNDYAPPDGDAPFAAHVEVTACPWQLKHRLVRIGIKGREMPAEARPAANLVFLLDVSGSMEPEDKLPRVRRAMRMLVEQLRENDRVAIVVYAAQSGLVLPSTTGFEKDRIFAALDSLHAGGGTNGGDGIRLAYDIAQQNFQKDGVNRVILCTDGDFNVGTTSNAELERLIEERAKSGVFLTVLGFGMGNHNDELMEKLADKGNGNYGYVDSEAEARKLLVEQAGGTLVTIAKDVKLQLEFNPRLVGAYRLIGYEDRLLAAEDFNNDQKDAGEIGAGHTVTALYELIPAGQPVAVPPVDELKYQRPASLTEAAGADELLTLKLKYKRPDGNESLAPIVCTVRDAGQPFGGASADTQFAAAVAGFGLLLRDSQYKGDLTYDAVIEIATQAAGPDAHGRRAEFLDLVRKAHELAKKP